MVFSVRAKFHACVVISVEGGRLIARPHQRISASESICAELREHDAVGVINPNAHRTFLAAFPCGNGRAVVRVDDQCYGQRRDVRDCAQCGETQDRLIDPVGQPRRVH